MRKTVSSSKTNYKNSKTDISILLAHPDNIQRGEIARIGVIFTSIAFLCFSGATLGRTGYTLPRGLGRAGSCDPSICGVLR